MANAISRTAAGPGWANDVNRIASGLLGQEHAEINLLKADKSGLFATLAESGVLLDTRLDLQSGAEIRLYNAGDTNYANLVHSGANDILKTDDGFWTAGALGVGVTPGALGAGNVLANANLGWKSGTANTVTLDHAATADRTVTVQDLAGTVALLGAANAGGHLLFVDATYDIGQSGATRPRHLFLSGNAVIGGTLSAGAGTFSSIITPTIGPDADSQHTLPNVAADTFALLASTQTIAAKLVRHQDGSAGTPSVSFDSDTNTGLYWVSADRIGVAAGGSQVLEVVNSGGTFGLGIGAAPSVALTVTRTVADFLASLSNASASGRGLSISTGGNSASDPLLYCESGGLQRFLIAADGTGAISNALRLADGSTGTPSLGFTSDTNTGVYWVSADRLGLTAGGSKVVEVVNSGGTFGVGIGMSPSVLVDLQRSAADWLLRIDQTSSSASAKVAYFKSANTSSSDQQILVETSGSQRFAVYGDGSAALGTVQNTGAGVLTLGGVLYLSGTTTRPYRRYDPSSILNNGTMQLHPTVAAAGGYFRIHDDRGYVATFGCDGGGTPRLADGDATIWSVTSGTASKTNVYYTGGTLTLENKSGATRTYRIDIWSSA